MDKLLLHCPWYPQSLPAFVQAVWQLLIFKELFLHFGAFEGLWIIYWNYVVLLFQRYIYALQALITFQTHTLRWDIYILEIEDSRCGGKIIYSKPYHQSVPIWMNTLQSWPLSCNASLTNSTGRFQVPNS